MMQTNNNIVSIDANDERWRTMCRWEKFELFTTSRLTLRPWFQSLPCGIIRGTTAIEYHCHRPLFPSPPLNIYFNQAFRISPVNYFARPHDEKIIANMKQRWIYLSKQKQINWCIYCILKPYTMKPLLSGPPNKRTPSIKRTLSWVPKRTSDISLYFSFKIFPRFWLAKRTSLNHHNQLLMTKFGRILTLTRKEEEELHEIFVAAVTKWEMLAAVKKSEREHLRHFLHKKVSILEFSRCSRAEKRAARAKLFFR